AQWTSKPPSTSAQPAWASCCAARHYPLQMEFELTRGTGTAKILGITVHLALHCSCRQRPLRAGFDSCCLAKPAARPMPYCDLEAAPKYRHPNCSTPRKSQTCCLVLLVELEYGRGLIVG